MRDRGDAAIRMDGGDRLSQGQPGRHEGRETDP
jgi:hypothetical protein